MTKRDLLRRLFPLYTATFLQGFVLWYAIEKLFMTSIGFNLATIGVMASVYAVIVLVVETPSGILADRWSRKGVLMLASVALALSSLICGLSTSVGMYIAGAVLWGVYDALFSGTTDSIVYDVLEETQGSSSGYERYYGFVEFIEGAALVSGALVGGAVGSILGLRVTYLLTIPLALLSIVALALFREPLLHKAKAAEPIVAHVKDTLRSVLHRGSIVGVLVVLVLGGVISELIYEFNQLWYIALALPVGWYGIAGAVLYGGYGIGGFISRFVKLENRLFVALMSVVLVGAGLVLALSDQAVLVVAAQTVATVGMGSIGVVYLHKMHDRLPSRIRAGASSAVSTMSRGVFAVAALVFGWLGERYSVFSSSWIIVGALVLVCVFLFASVNDHKPKTV